MKIWWDCLKNEFNNTQGGEDFDPQMLVRRVNRRKNKLNTLSQNDVNKAYMLRANWRLCKRDPPLWSSIIRSKYGCGQNIVPSINPNMSGDNFQKALCSTWDPFFVKIPDKLSVMILQERTKTKLRKVQFSKVCI